MVRKTHLRLVETPQPVNGGLRIAFASSDQQSVDQHFGTAIGFVIYELSESAAQQVEICRFAASAQDGDHGKLIDRML
ncbi:MAG: nitrogen fixation protein NifX, partial [Anaerolineae bacterium]|nr:nitrogen fixation protein NifX [Anaerolineae bacterium]